MWETVLLEHYYYLSTYIIVRPICEHSLYKYVEVYIFNKYLDMYYLNNCNYICSIQNFIYYKLIKEKNIGYSIYSIIF